MDVDPRCNFVEKFTGGIIWYMMEGKDFFVVLVLNLKREQ